MIVPHGIQNFYTKIYQGKGRCQAGNCPVFYLVILRVLQRRNSRVERGRPTNQLIFRPKSIHEKTPPWAANGFCTTVRAPFNVP